MNHIITTSSTGALDGAEVATAVLCLNVLHPAFLRTFQERRLTPHHLGLIGPLKARTDLPSTLSPIQEELPPEYKSFDHLAVDDSKVVIGMAV